jgi:signal transduction histidine kinase
VASYIGVIALAVVIVSLYVGYSVRQRFATFEELTLGRQADTLASRVRQVYLANGGNLQSAQQLITNSANLTRSDIFLFDATGNQRAIATDDPQTTAPSLDDIKPALRGQRAFGHRSDGWFGTGHAYAIVPIIVGKEVVGALYLSGEPGSPGTRRPPPDVLVANEFLAGVNRQIMLGGIVAGLLAALIGAYLARGITRPLREITAAVTRIAGGDYAQRVRIRSQDEIGRLAIECNRMAETLERDVGELKRQEQLRRDLVANVSHDLSTPLTGIQGFTEALLDDVVKSDPDRRETYQTIYAEVLRLRRLVDDLKNLTQLEAGPMTVVTQPLSLGLLAQEILRVEQVEANERGVTLLTTIDESLPAVLVDGDRIGQVLFNLIDNALRYTPHGGVITVSASVQESLVWVDVTDTGEGIAPEQLPFIFERFYRVDPSRSRRTGGGGLGLAIVKAIVEAHGGTVEARSISGAGTTMRFSLRVATTPTGAVAGKREVGAAV